MCVDAFPLSTSRGEIMNGLEGIVGKLNEVLVEGELWLDGSYLTEKINPADVDVVLRIRGEFYDEATPTQQAVIKLVGDNLKTPLMCDSYVFMEWEEAHPLHEWGRKLHAYWLMQWGQDRSGAPKGMVVLTLEGGAH